jgi:hypothetical protein
MSCRSAILAVAALTAAFLASAGPAGAALGRAYSSVDTDRLTLGATVASTFASTFAGAYTVHTLTLPNHGVVKEFTRADGLVFALVWQAPGRPDLRQLLGDNFEIVQADNARVGPRVRRPLAVNRANLVLKTGGHPGAFWGAALLPQLEPAGFSASDLK